MNNKLQYLIDTHVLLWLVNDSTKLGKNTRKLLSNTAYEVVLSYFSIFEIVTKVASGKLLFDTSVIDDLPDIGIKLLLPHAHTLDTYQVFDSANKDPFDNALVSIAVREKYTLVTSDKKLLRLNVPLLQTMDAGQ